MSRSIRERDGLGVCLGVVGGVVRGMSGRMVEVLLMVFGLVFWVVGERTMLINPRSSPQFLLRYH